MKYSTQFWIFAEFKYQNRGERVTKILNIIPYYLFPVNVQYSIWTTWACHNAHIEVEWAETNWRKYVELKGFIFHIHVHSFLIVALLIVRFSHSLFLYFSLAYSDSFSPVFCTDFHFDRYFIFTDLLRVPSFVFAIKKWLLFTVFWHITFWIWLIFLCDICDEINKNWHPYFAFQF